MARVFLLSPANCSGERMGYLLRRGASFPLARELQSRDGAALGDVFAFASALYFRGKLAYAAAFGRGPADVPGGLVMAPGLGLVPPSLRVRAADLRRIGRVPVDPDDRRYRRPLERDARTLADALSGGGDAVLLGSIASAKYTSVLLEILGEKLLFPADFVGRGDLSRGGLMLRASRAGEELRYVPVAGAVVKGARPAKLPRLPRSAATNRA